MKLTYTIEIDVQPAQERNRDKISAKIMRAAFEMVGKKIAGRELRCITIWPHQDSRPESVPDELREDWRDEETCPTCGTPEFTREMDSAAV